MAPAAAAVYGKPGSGIARRGAGNVVCLWLDTVALAPWLRTAASQSEHHHQLSCFAIYVADYGCRQPPIRDGSGFGADSPASSGGPHWLTGCAHDAAAATELSGCVRGR